MNNEQLKGQLKQYGLKTSGTKAELTTRLREHLGQAKPNPINVAAVPTVAAPAILAPLAPITVPAPKLQLPTFTLPKVPLTAAPATVLPVALATAAPATPSPTATAYDKMKVLELREELKRRGLKSTGNKPELIQRLMEAGGEVQTPVQLTPPKTGVVPPLAVIQPSPTAVTTALGGTITPQAATVTTGGNYGTMNINQLKDELRKRGLKLGGNKPELIQRLQDYDGGKLQVTTTRATTTAPVNGLLGINFANLKLVPLKPGESPAKGDSPAAKEVSEGSEEDEDEDDEVAPIEADDSDDEDDDDEEEGEEDPEGSDDDDDDDDAE